MALPKSATKKRKHTQASLTSRKRSRKEVTSVNDLPWRSISRPNAFGFEGDDGILELEEVDDVEVIYEETENGRVAKFKIREAEERVNESSDEPHSSGSEDERDENEFVQDVDTNFDVQTLLPEWSPFKLHPHILRSIHSQGFDKPTPIQKDAIPFALEERDIIGVAETGSGKTLAYGLPILNGILSRKTLNKKLQALILAPTRELALQVVSHLNACIRPASSSNGSTITTKNRMPLNIAAVVGGMAVQKQRRIIERGVDVIVATPGRLWELIQEDNDLARQIGDIHYLVLDEADRMIETGHFAELDNIIRITSRQFKTAKSDPDFLNNNKSGTKKEEESVESVLEEEKEEVETDDETKLQTFVFSATLSKDLQQNLQRRKRPTSKRKGQTVQKSSTLDELIEKLDFRDPEPRIIDLSPKGGLVSTLKESQVECLSADKDVYLYYFLLRYPGRSLVFLSSIDGIRRLLPLCSLLNLNAFPLHSQLQQRQRLKNLDRFKSTPRSVLLATDVAARGLDVPAVDHVIHYQIPRSADVYIHRNGRTARASRDGFSLLICGPDERRAVRALLASLGRVGENEIPQMPFEIDLLDKLKERVQLAKKIDNAEHQTKKEKHEKNWLKEAAEAMEIELDSDLDDSPDEDSSRKKRVQNNNTKKLQSLKAELKHLLSQPLVAHGVMKKYITSGARSVVSELLNSDGTTGILGFKQGDAKNHLLEGQGQDKARKKKQKQKATQQKEAEEEWKGFAD